MCGLFLLADAAVFWEGGVNLGRSMRHSGI